MGTFITISHAFDPRFHGDTTPPQALVDEIASAQSHFASLIHLFSNQFILILKGLAVHSSYIVNHMLAKFAAAVVVFAKAINDEQEVNKQAGEKRGEEEEEGISYFQLKAQIDGIIGQSYPEVLKYYRYCVNNGHKHFT